MQRKATPTRARTGNTPSIKSAAELRATIHRARDGDSAAASDLIKVFIMHLKLSMQRGRDDEEQITQPPLADYIIDLLRRVVSADGAALVALGLAMPERRSRGKPIDPKTRTRYVKLAESVWEEIWRHKRETGKKLAANRARGNVAMRSGNDKIESTMKKAWSDFSVRQEAKENLLIDRMLSLVADHHVAKGMAPK